MKANLRPTSKLTFIHRVFCYNFDQDSGWFRIFGRGLSWKRIDERPLLFSERNGKVNYIVVRGWLVRVCPKWKS